MIFRLLKEHRINGVTHPIGHEVEFPQQAGEWLVEQGIFEHVTTTPVLAMPPSPVVSATVQRRPMFAQQPASRFKCCGWT